ncbi:MAG: hypothetical protein QOG33_2714 [Gaiellales bacterium]|jgi:hypothetical protein|nr:hypothetical protein [Gaiellales bacterium]
MKKLLTLMLAGLALALPAVALADTCMLTHLGVNVSSRTVTGSCTSRKLALTGSLLLRCDNSTGYAIARYNFTMPKTWTGTASPVVDAVGDPSYWLIKLDATHVRVVVRTSGLSKVVIASVSVGFIN